MGLGMQRPVKGSHLFIQFSSFNTSCFLFDGASEKDGYSEDLNSKEDVGNDLFSDEFVNVKACLSGFSLTVHQTADRNDCVGVEKQDQAVKNGLGSQEINATFQGIYKVNLHNFKPLSNPRIEKGGANA